MGLTRTIKSVTRTATLTPPGRRTPVMDIPPGTLLKGKLWCPYCAEPTVFKKDPELDVKKCKGCGISDRDFHVKTANRLWHSIFDKKIKK